MQKFWRKVFGIDQLTDTVTKLYSLNLDLTKEVSSLKKRIDGLNDTIVEHFEGTVDLGVITDKDAKL